MSYFFNRYKECNPEFREECSLMSTIRVNTLLIDEKELVKRLEKKKVKLKKVPWLKHAYEYEADFSLASTPEYLLGYYYIQDAASQLVPEILNPSKNDTVLDMCAAPGSKTTQLAQLMDNKGVIIALDNVHARILALKNNIERLGCENIVVYSKDAAYVNTLDLKFDKILLDAPCSGNYCIEKEWSDKRMIEDIKEKSKFQKKLIKSAYDVMKKGGVLVYSTCSLEKEEDEEVIEWALSNLKLKLEMIDISIGSEGLTSKTKLCRRFWPYETRTQGFFIAKMRK